MNKFKTFLMVIITAVISTIGWNNLSFEQTSSDITNYYFYQGHKFYLNQEQDMIYIKLKNTVSKAEFNNLIRDYGDTPADYSFEKNDTRQFVQLRANLDNVSMNNVISLVNNNPLVEYASSVFSMVPGTGNDNTLMGCENNIVVQFKPSYNRNQIDQYLNSKSLSIIQELELTGGLSFIIQIPYAPGRSSLDFANEIYASGMTNYSDPGLYFTNLLAFVPNDPFFPQQWSAINTGTNIPVTGIGTPDCDMGLDTAWNQTLGIPQCVVSIVDSGIDTTHPDLAANVVNGYNFNYFSNTYGGIDDFGHGASCAGIVAAIGNNNLGISGVCPQARVFSAKIFSSSGGTTTAAIVNALIGVRTFGNSWISSNSWGGGAPIAAGDNAITDGTTLGRNGKGIVWCFATHNGNSALVWPSTHPNVISVGGNSPCNQRKSPSSCDLENFWGANFGTGLDIVAPCVKIYATVQGGGYTSTFNGTSSATPNSSGVAALLLSKDSNQTWDTVRQRINRSALKKGSYSYTSVGPLGNLGSTWNNEMGYGIINANLALLAVGPPPPPPSVEDSSICRNGLNKAITDFNLTQDSISITVGANCNVIDVNVKIDTVIHTFISDLVVRLRKGSLSSILVNQRGGSGDNFINTRLNDSAANPIGGGSAPFNGEFRPETPLSVFNSQPVNGSWILSIRDTASGDQGVLRSWCLTIKYDCLSGPGGEITTTIPGNYQLMQNYPNPFNPNTKIKFGLPKQSAIKLIVYDMLGREVRVLYQGLKSAGQHEVDFDGTNLASGIYYYKLEAGDFSDVKKMVIVK